MTGSFNFIFKTSINLVLDVAAGQREGGLVLAVWLRVA